MSAGSKFHSCGVEMEKPLLRIVPSDIEGPGAEPGTTTEGCALLECHSRSGIARSSTPMHGQPGSCWRWSWACIEYETEPGASEGHAELQPRLDHICQFWGSNVQQNLGPIRDVQGGRHLSHREGCWRNRLACRWRHGPKFGWLMMWVSKCTYLTKLVVARLAEFGDMVLHV